MSAVESRPPGRDQEHANVDPSHDVSLNQFSSPAGASANVTASEQFYAMTQPDITFTAEPASIMDFTSYPGLSPPGDGYEADTSTAAGSYSSLHPGNGAQPFSFQQNGFLSHQDIAHPTKGLSPSAASVNDQFGSEGYLSDSVYADYSRYTTPNMDDQVLGDQYSLLTLQDQSSAGQYSAPYDPSNITPSGFDANSVPTFISPTLRNPGVPTSNQLLSPSLTSNSSPVIQDEGAQNQSAVPEKEPFPKITTSLVQNNQQQYSPALSVSPPREQRHQPQQHQQLNQQPLMNHLTSPIDIRVENYSPEEATETAELNRALSQRSRGNKRSATHLSPYGAEDSSDDEEDLDSPQVPLAESTVRVPATPQERNEDGSWKITSPGGQAGVSPVERKKLNGAEIPSLREQDDAMLVAEKNADVEEWLSHSEVGSDSGDIDPNKPAKRKKSVNRRRAKSFNDMQPRLDTRLALGLGVQTDFIDDSGIPGPGVYIDERSELDEDEDDGQEYSDSDSDGNQGPQSPPAPVDMIESANEPPGFLFDADDASQPPTSNAAIMRFVMRARENDNASITATLGSRRMSESDLGSLFAAGGISKQIITPEIARKPKEKRDRRPSFLETLLPKRSNSNLRKRKGTHPVSAQPADSGQASPKEASSTATPPKRTSSWGRSLPRVDTNMSANSKDGAANIAARGSTTSGPFSGITKAIQRHRSRSDLGKSPGLAQLMTQHGGPPMPYLASPLAGPDSSRRSPPPPPAPNSKDDSDADDFMAQEAVIMDLKVRSDPIIPTYEGFRTHARQLNPRLVEFMVERITQEQMRRYKRLLEYRVKHANAVRNRNCSSSKFCLALGGQSKILPPRTANKEGETPFIGFQVTAPGSSDEENEALSEGTVVAAQFPPGVPLPPVKRLPAEFECPLCFKVKKFQKPSDWTKHVHEDVQPFTCTFPNCGEPKSFKRKADWVRHENERHRQLENWTCSIGDCTHTCYRKDNFVQHLVREHKLPEPRPRTGRSRGDVTPQDEGGSSWGQNNLTSAGDRSDDVWALVERCRRDTTKQPKDEQCRFCGNICNSWKKLTVHLAKHMEQISMPILPLVEQKLIHADTIISPIDFPQPEKIPTPVRSPADNPSRYNPATNGPALTAGLDPSYAAQISSNLSPSPVSSGTMHTYPPPEAFSFRASPNTTASNLDFTDAQTSYAVRSYPGVGQPPRQPRSSYMNGLQIPSNRVTGTTSPQNHATTRFAPPMTPVSAFENTPAVFSSPVETTTFGGEGYPNTSYCPPTPQQPSATETNITPFPDVNFGQSSNVQYQQHQGQYQMNAFMQQSQQNQYSYQGQ